MSTIGATISKAVSDIDVLAVVAVVAVTYGFVQLVPILPALATQFGDIIAVLSPVAYFGALAGIAHSYFGFKSSVATVVTGPTPAPITAGS